MTSKVRTSQPRCFIVYAIAPKGMAASGANQEFNRFVADTELPLALFHDHFIGQIGGVAIFYVSSKAEGRALIETAHLADWELQIHPLIFSRTPAAFDEQIAFTLSTYRETNWEELQIEKRPGYGKPQLEEKAKQGTQRV